MAMTQLTSVVQPPVEAIDSGPIECRQAIEESIGLRLPQDIVDISLAYGSGTFSDGQLWILNPFASWYRSNIDEICRIFRQLKADEGDSFVPFDVYPAKPGLFPWGSEANGHQMFWLTTGEPDLWPMVLWNRDTTEFEELRMPVSTFVSKILTCELQCILWSPETQQRLRPVFESI